MLRRFVLWRRLRPRLRWRRHMLWLGTRGRLRRYVLWRWLRLWLGLRLSCRCHMFRLGLRRHRGFSRLGRLHAARFSGLRRHCRLSRDGAGFCSRLHLSRFATRLDLTRLAAGLHRTGLHLTGFSGLNHTRFGWGAGLDHARLCRPARLHRPRFSRSAGGRHRLDLFVGRQLLNLGLLLRG